MRLYVTFVAVLIGILGAVYAASKTVATRVSWSVSGSQHKTSVKAKQQVNAYAPFGSYGTEVDWNDPARVIQLNYEQDQGKRVFYQQCVWCHADSTPAGPSNRSNVTPDPPLLNDGTKLNGESDETLRKIIAQGGSGMGKSPMMPPYGLTLTSEEINEVIAYIRAVSVPDYRSSIGQNNKGKGSRL